MHRKKIRLILADDHEVYLDGLSLLLRKEADLEVIDVAVNGEELVEKVMMQKPDVAIVDLNLPLLSGIDAIKEITARSVTRCLAHTFHSHTFMIQDALDAGAIGFVVKNAQRGEITHAVRSVASNKFYCCRITESVLAKVLAASRFNPRRQMTEFSDKEIRIMFMIAMEKTSDQIGKELYIARRSVEGIRSKILSKINAKTPAGIVLYALKNHLFSIDDVDLGKLEV